MPSRQFNTLKSIFSMAKGKALEKEDKGDKTVGQDSNEGKFNIGTFKGQMTKANGLARANRYMVTIRPGPNFWGLGNDAIGPLRFFCDNVNIPGASIIPIDHKRQGIGPFDRRASAIVPAEISASFMLDARGRNLQFFQDWISNTVYMGPKNNNIATHVSDAGLAFGEMRYRSEYICEMDIETYDMAANKINTLTAYEVWPSQLGDVTLGWAQNDEVARVTINFQLQRWVTENHQLPEGTADESHSNRQLSPMEQLLRIGQSAVALKSSWKKPRNVGDVINIASNAQTFLGSFGGKKG